MAQIRNFTSTNDSYFVLDGVSYPKVYEAMLDNGYTKDKVKLVGTNRDSSPLVFSTHYSNIRVDGVSFANAQDAISRLNQVVFSKGGGSGDGGTGIQSIQEGDNISIDNTDPLNPIVSTTGGGDSGLTLEEARQNGNIIEGMILGTEEFYKDGDRTAFAQLSDVYDNAGIPLTGTLSHQPVVGDIRISDFAKIDWDENTGIKYTIGIADTPWKEFKIANYYYASERSYIKIDNFGIDLKASNGSDEVVFMFRPNQIFISKELDYPEENSFVQRSYVDRRIDEVIPIPPATGTYTLQSVDGVLTWI